MAFRYRAFGLSIASSLELPELVSDYAEGPADVAVELGSVPSEPPPDGTQLGPFVWADRDWLWMTVPGVATYWVCNGRLIQCQPQPGIDDDSIRVFLLGSIFGALLLQRGHLVLHGNAIAVGNATLLCLGDSGAGKSTLALGFTRRGYPVLADDVVAIDERARALPGLPRIKVWRDVADKLGIDTALLPRVRPAMEKFSLLLGDAGGRTPLPVQRIFLLSQGHLPDIAIEPVEGVAAFAELRDSIYRPSLAEGMKLDAEHLAGIGKLVSEAKILRLRRPLEGFHLERMVDLILDELNIAE